MRLSVVASFVTLVSLGSSVPTSDPASRITPRDDAQQLDALQQQALDATLAALDAEEQELQKRGQTASCTRQNLEIRLE
jgi:hypothetical protein